MGLRFFFRNTRYNSVPYLVEIWGSGSSSVVSLPPSGKHLASLSQLTPPPPSPCWEWGRCRFAQQQLTRSSCSSAGALVPVCTGWPPSSSSCSYSSSSGRSSSHSSWSSPVLPQLTPLWQAVHVSFLVSVYAPVSGRGLLLSSVGTGSISPFSLDPWL